MKSLLAGLDHRQKQFEHRSKASHTLHVPSMHCIITLARCTHSNEQLLLVRWTSILSVAVIQEVQIVVCYVTRTVPSGILVRSPNTSQLLADEVEELAPPCQGSTPCNFLARCIGGPALPRIHTLQFLGKVYRGQQKMVLTVKATNRSNTYVGLLIV